tara:strand:- start:91 stop:498 length:408 start_codon:yes stop_codon:yes gene_type:complete
MNKQQRISTKNLKTITLISYFSLLLFMPLWLILLSPSNGLSPMLTLIMFTLPLLFPLKGLVAGNPYTYAWSSFIIMIYFLHSLTTLWVSPKDMLWASIELLLATVMFLAGSYYAKYRGQELGLSIRTKKDSDEDQ